MLFFDFNNPFAPTLDLTCKENLLAPKLFSLTAPHKTKP